MTQTVCTVVLALVVLQVLEMISRPLALTVAIAALIASASLLWLLTRSPKSEGR